MSKEVGSQSYRMILVRGKDSHDVQLCCVSHNLCQQFSTLCRAMGARQPQAGHGFVRTYYAPYFVEMERRGFVPAFAYLTHSSQANAPEVQQWLATHRTQVQVFQEWSRSYEWPKLKQ